MTRQTADGIQYGEQRGDAEGMGVPIRFTGMRLRIKNRGTQEVIENARTPSFQAVP